jgi:hypothetical protein
MEVDMSPVDATAHLAWQELHEAGRFADACFRRWQEAGEISMAQLTAILSFSSARRELWFKLEAAGEQPPDNLGLPPGRPDESAPAKAWRYWNFVEAEVRRHEATSRLTLAQSHALQTEARERLAALRQRLDREDIPEVTPVFDKDQKPKSERRPLLEMVLDPRNIHWLLALGGALMVTGLIILLWVNEYFTPPVLALTLAVGNTALLLGGWATIRYTRYQMAGRALTLLACLIMPLNLWYYNANNLLTIAGHLWVAAVVISALYAASAWVLRDELFVYVFAAGVAMTGLLILADLPPSPEKFWEIASPSTLLVVLGLLGIHAERAFPEREGPFSRRRFGLAFFWSGQALLAAGLLLLLGAQIAADWLYEPIFKYYYERWHAARTPMVTETWGQIWALCLVLAGFYAYIYSDVVVRRVGAYVYLAAGALMWAEVLGLRILDLALGTDALIIVLAATALVANAAYSAGSVDNRMTRAFPVLGLLLGLLATLLGLSVYARALSPDLRSVWNTTPPSWTYVGATLLTAAACRFGAYATRLRLPRLTILYFFATGAATMVAAVALLAALGLTRWQDHAPWLMLLPIAYLIASRLYRGGPAEAPLIVVAHAATAVMLISSLASSVEGFTHIVQEQPLNLVLALFFAEAAFFYALAAAWHKQVAAIHLAAAMGCATLWQLLTYLGVQSETYTLTFALVGVALLVAYRFAVLERFQAPALASAAFHSGNVLLSLAFLASLFMGASRLATQHVHWDFVRLCAMLIAINVLAVALVRVADWRRWYVVMAVFQGLLMVLAIQVLSTLTIFQKLEIFSVAAGLGLLLVGHLGWYREQDRHNDLVSISLFLGSLLTGVPLAIATLVDRWHDHFIVWNEIGFLAVSIALLASGFVLQLKSTTLTGAALSVLYFLMLLIYVPWSRLNAVALMIITGGGLIFAIGLVLSVYRDRLLALPERIHRHEGVFRVLTWR